MENLLIFIPDSLKKCESDYLIGIFDGQKNNSVCKSLYIFGVQSLYCKSVVKSYPIVGCYKNKSEFFPGFRRRKNFVVVSYKKEVTVKKVIINHESFNLGNCHIILYDDIALIKSELFLPKIRQITDEGDHFKILTYHLKRINLTELNMSRFKLKIVSLVIFIFENILRLMDKCYTFLCLTTLGMHIYQSLQIFSWLIITYKSEGKITLKTGNILMSILIDVIFGYALLSMLVESTNSNDILNLIASYTESIISSIELTIKWLMGSPWGIKLNYPLNYILGNFFLYNIKLWWIFLGLVRPLLEVAFFTFLKIGLLGLSYQIAILGDIFSVVSFHVYCIYIYAAKLYYWQVSGLYSLSRIFLGRNQNPQPGKVDSCPYTTEQLFVGTICFTVLLFLLPTTLVYYIVFTLMRLGVNIVGGVMTRARYFIQALPLYSTLVWIFNPKFTAGERF
ncbi:phosphatidylinositol glycan anchor biosynthesis class Q isoform X2 [Rhodnius prolixus]|uniref:phosphatidylinositol glycan anchor biosynthesis class Q isoform X2 n=1 Tax=Rhodnius prolixus TaxID=13249 RepID=UPI003D18EAF2